MFSALALFRKKSGLPSKVGNKIFHVEKREYWPLIAGGLAIILATRLAHYAQRAVERVNGESSDAARNDDHKDSIIDADIQEPRTYNSAPSREQDITQAIGLDIGSLFAKISYRNGEIGTEIIENSEGHRATSTAVHSDDNDSIPYIGRTAIKNRWLKPTKTAFSTQLLIGLHGTDPVFKSIVSSIVNPPAANSTSEAIFTVGSRFMTPSACSTVICRELLKTASAKVGNVPTILSVPDFFGTVQRNAAVEACRGAGFDCLAAVPDAVCAVIGARALKLMASVQGPVLVVDFGGRLVQLSIVQSKKDNEPPVVVRHEPLFGQGSEYLDQVLVRHISGQFAREHGIDLLADPMAVLRLYEAAEQAKIDLCGHVITKIQIPFVTADRYGPKHLDLTLSRARFEDVISPAITQFNERLLSFVGHDCAPAAVLIVGGGARVPILSSSLLERLKLSDSVPVITCPAPEEVVCIGAAEYSRYL